MFKIGKEYVSKASHITYKCLAMTPDQRPIMGRDKDGSWVAFDVSEYHLSNFEEIKPEPKVIGYANIYSCPITGGYSSKVHPTAKQAESLASTERSVLARIKIVEGQFDV